MNDFSQQGTAKDAYQYNYTYIEPIPMVNTLPQSENFSLPWIVLTAQQAFKLAINTLLAGRGDRGEAGARDDVQAFLHQTLMQTLKEQGPTFKFKLVGALLGLVPQLLNSGATARGGAVSDVELTQAIDAAVQQLLQGLPSPNPQDVQSPMSRSAMPKAAEATETEHLINAESEAIKGVDIALNQLSQGTVPCETEKESMARGQSPAAAELSQVSNLPAGRPEVEVAKGLEASSLLQQDVPTIATSQLEGSSRPDRAARAEPALQEMKSTKAEVARGVETALQQLLSSAPSNEAEVAKFFTSNLVKVLGADLLKPFAHNVLMGLKQQVPHGRPQGLADYEHLFAYLKRPQIANTFQDDRVFAYMRLAGPNPVMIEQMQAGDPRFPVTDAQYQSVMGPEDSLQVALSEGRVYLADYGILDGAINGTYGPQPMAQKYGYAPLALFAVPRGEQLLQPVAIQCGQNPADYDVITPSTGEYAWLIAKTVVQIADGNFHEAVSHFARTHLLIEPFVMATHRSLPSTHPLFTLLTPHFQGTLAINDSAKGILVAPLGGVNGLLSSTIDQSRVLVVKGYQARGFNADMLPQRLHDRGVADASQLPVYPYRDDGLLIWGAIHDWVAAYFNLYYPSDEAVKQDAALQDWAAELTRFDGGRLQDFGDRGSGKIETLAYLIEAVTMIIFTGSAQHAAVNFPQSEIMSFAPAMPTAGYQPIKTLNAETTEADWLALLPPLEQAQAQLNLLYLLGSVYFTKLGEYDQGHFSDTKVAEPLRHFQQRLREIDQIIDRANIDRPVYTDLKPSKIPQSINI